MNQRNFNNSVKHVLIFSNASHKALTPLLTALLVLLCSLFIVGVTTSCSMPETKEIQILATSDMHGKFLAYNYTTCQEDTSGSTAQIATAIKSLRTDSTLVLDGGDFVQDNMNDCFVDESINPMTIAMNEIGYDAWVIGNHGFDYGPDYLRKTIDTNNATCLCGNVKDKSGQTIGADYIIIEKSGIKIGIIGMTTPNLSALGQKSYEGYSVENPVIKTKEIADQIRGEVDVLIALEHMGVEKEYGIEGSGVRDLAQACPNLDLIIAAHAHVAIAGEVINGVPIVENANSAKTLAKVNLVLKKDFDESWHVEKEKSSFEVLKMEDFQANEQLVSDLLPYHEQAIQYANTVIGTFVDSYLVAPNIVKGIPTALIESTKLTDFINEVQLYYASEAKVSIASVFTSDANLEQGEIKRCDVSQIYPYNNVLCTVKLNGKQLKKWMEWSAEFYNTFCEGDLTISFNPEIPLYQYDVFAGVKYHINISQEPGQRIENLSWPNGTPVSDTEEFVVAINDYRAMSALLVPGAIFAEDEALPQLVEWGVRSDIGSIRELLVDYIQNVKQGTLTVQSQYGWKLTGYQYNHELRDKAVQEINDGNITIPSENGGASINSRSITENDLLHSSNHNIIQNGLGDELLD